MRRELATLVWPGSSVPITSGVCSVGFGRDPDADRPPYVHMREFAHSFRPFEIGGAIRCREQFVAGVVRALTESRLTAIEIGGADGRFQCLE